MPKQLCQFCNLSLHTELLLWQIFEWIGATVSNQCLKHSAQKMNYTWVLFSCIIQQHTLKLVEGRMQTDHDWGYLHHKMRQRCVKSCILSKSSELFYDLQRWWSKRENVWRKVQEATGAPREWRNQLVGVVKQKHSKHTHTQSGSVWIP